MIEKSSEIINLGTHAQKYKILADVLVSTRLFEAIIVSLAGIVVVT